MFSPRVYQRMFEMHNDAVWPLHLLTGAFGLFILYRLMRHGLGADRFIFVALGLIWVWIAWSFFWESYYQINWPARFVAPAFALQGLFLIWMGIAHRRLILFPINKAFHAAGVILFAMALFAYPLMPLTTDWSWQSAQFFGITPDPTAVATLALLFFARSPLRWILIIIPFLWALMSGLTHWAINTTDFALTPILAPIIIGLALANESRCSSCKRARQKMT